MAHFDHGIHPDSARVAAGVRALARATACRTRRAAAHSARPRARRVARAARYAWLEATRAPAGRRR